MFFLNGFLMGSSSKATISTYWVYHLKNDGTPKNHLTNPLVHHKNSKIFLLRPRVPLWQIQDGLFAAGAGSLFAASGTGESLPVFGQRRGPGPVRTGGVPYP